MERFKERHPGSDPQHRDPEPPPPPPDPVHHTKMTRRWRLQDTKSKEAQDLIHQYQLAQDPEQQDQEAEYPAHHDELA